MRKMNLNGKLKYETECKLYTDYSVGFSCLFNKLDRSVNIDDKYVII